MGQLDVGVFPDQNVKEKKRANGWVEINRAAFPPPPSGREGVTDFDLTCSFWGDKVRDGMCLIKMPETLFHLGNGRRADGGEFPSH